MKKEGVYFSSEPIRKRYYRAYVNDTPGNVNVSNIYTLEIKNTAPTHTTPVINSSDLLNRTNGTIYCWNQSTSDIDGDMVINYYKWFNNSKLIVEVDDSSLGPGNFSKGDNISCEITPGDGILNGSALNSTNLTILNSAPSIPNVTFPVNNTNYSDIPYINYSSGDADGDPISYTIYINNTLNITTTVNVTDWNASDGYYNLTVTANDSTDFSANSTVVNFRLDTTEPSFSNNKTNASSTTYNGTDVQLNLTITDNGAGIDFYRLMTNDTSDNTWVNETIIDISQNSVTAIFNYTIHNFSTSGGTLGWRVWANDTVGNVNISNIYTFVVQAAPMVILNKPENNSNITADYVTLNWTIVHPTSLMEVWVYGSNDTNYFNTSWLYHKKNLPQETYTYNWSGIPVQPDDNTVLLFHFNNRSEFGENDNTVHDFSENGNTGTCSGATCPVFSWDGKFAGAFEFDGVDDRFTVSDSPDFDIFDGDFTVAAWIKTSSSTDKGQIIGQYDITPRWALRIWDSAAQGAGAVFYENDGNGARRFAGSTNIRDSKWHHVVAVGTAGGTGKIYLDGIDDTAGSDTLQSNFNSNNDLTIATTETGASAIAATIDEVAIWNRALSEDEISFLAKSPGKLYWQVNVTNGTYSDISEIREFTLIPPIGFYQYPTVSFYNETTEIILFEANKAVNATVEYGTDTSYGTLLNEPSLLEFSTTHGFNITGLNHGTKYYYRINITNVTGKYKYFDSFNSSFITVDYSLTSFKFIVYGDSREEDGRGTGVHAPIFRNLTLQIIEKEPAFVINVGDATDTDGNNYDVATSAWKEYTDVMWDLTDHIPAFIAIGNHELPSSEYPLQRYREVLIHPHNGNGSIASGCYQSNCYDETTYSFRYGNSLFISLNSEEVDNQGEIVETQQEWLNKTLNTTEYTHKFVFIHRPVMGSGRSVSNPDELEEIFDYYNVTTVFAGHNHYYCRNHTATLNIITGGAGANLRDPDEADGQPCYSVDEGTEDEVEFSVYHFVNITVVGNTIYGNAVNLTGDVIDNFTWTAPT